MMNKTSENFGIEIYNTLTSQKNSLLISNTVKQNGSLEEYKENMEPVFLYWTPMLNKKVNKEEQDEVEENNESTPIVYRDLA